MYDKYIMSSIYNRANINGFNADELENYMASIKALSAANEELYGTTALTDEQLGNLAIAQMRNEQGTKALVDKYNSLKDSTKVGADSLEQMTKA